MRLTFRRGETSRRSEDVLLDGFDRHAALPRGELVPVELVPCESGRSAFTCGLGMLTGTVVERARCIRTSHRRPCRRRLPRPRHASVYDRDLRLCPPHPCPGRLEA